MYSLIVYAVPQTRESTSIREKTSFALIQRLADARQYLRKLKSDVRMKKG